VITPANTADAVADLLGDHDEDDGEATPVLESRPDGSNTPHFRTVLERVTRLAIVPG
jgi:hypothetical protein